MAARFSAWLKRRAPVLFKDNMPVWLTFVVSLLAAVGAYYISPVINRQFQVDAARSEHLSRTTGQLNSEIIELSQKVRRLNEALVNKSKKAPELREDCLDRITKLQWMLVDLRVVLKSEEDRESLDRLARAIGGVKNALDRAVDARAQPELLDAMRVLGTETRDVLNRLYVRARLKEPERPRS